jgi:selenide,water dikinase
VHPDKVLTNRGGKAGDRLILTKPLGTGIVSTAIKAELAPAGVQQAIVDSMITLNRQAAECLAGFTVHACTDVTGFGLAGHLAEMIEDSEVGALLQTKSFPVFEGVEDFSAQGLLPGGLQRNRKHREAMVRIDGSVPQFLQDILFDPQTSGGLLVAVPADQAEDLLDRLRKSGISHASVIGELTTEAGVISVS